MDMGRAKCFRLTLGPDGHIEMPADVRNGMSVSEGDILVGQFDEWQMTICSLGGLVRRAQEEFKGVYPEGVSGVDALLRERRAMWGAED